MSWAKGIKGKRWMLDIIFMILGVGIGFYLDSWHEEKLRTEKLEADLAEAAQHMDSALPDQINKALVIYERCLAEIRKDKEPYSTRRSNGS